MRQQAPSFYRSGGFSLGELLIALALGAVVISAATVAFGTLIRNQPRAGSAATVTLSSALYNAYYGLSVSSQVINVAPNYGAVVQAENMREKFLADTLAATAVFCLSRNTDEPNYTHPFQVSHNVASDTYPYIDCGETFRLHLVAKGLAKNTAPGTVGQTYFTPSVRNYSATAPNASVFVLTYSNVSDTSTGGSGNLLRIKAVYDIDLNRSNSPVGYYASVKRWAADSSTSAARLTDYYDVFYPLSPQANGTPGTWATTTDAFMPLWVAFERPLYTESSTIDAFKKARENPFYFIWWPDPAAQTLSLYGGTTSSFLTSDPRKAYNLMAGRTSFMFTVPIFPVL